MDGVADFGEIAAASLLTRAGGPVRTSESLRDKVAIFSDGRCLVSRNNAQDVDVLSAIALARRLGVKTVGPELVDLGALRSIYHGRVGSADRRVSRDDTTMQREVQELLRHAARLQASDIHLVVDSHRATLKVRVDGELRPMPGGTVGSTGAWHADYGRQVCMTAYAMAAEGGTADANFDPFGYQAGRMTTHLPDGVQAVRLQFNPVGFSGRHLAMRLLYAGHAAGATLPALGFAASQVEALTEFADQRSGLLVIAGPTGPGKSTTLERMMQYIVAADPGGNIMSVEDPPEYRIPGVVQLAVSNLRNDDDREHAYAEAIAAVLRSDPDRIMIGEIRTRSTAHYAFEAAMTGHQVLTTVHANDALGIVPRLMDIGVESYKLRDPSLIRGLVAQRLVRRLCEKCRRPVPPSKAGLRRELGAFLESTFPDQPIWLPGIGCAACREGYDGRTVIAELVSPDQHLLELLCAGERQTAVDYWRESLAGQPFQMHALQKIEAGIVDPGQIEARVCRLTTT